MNRLLNKYSTSQDGGNEIEIEMLVNREGNLEAHLVDLNEQTRELSLFGPRALKSAIEPGHANSIPQQLAAIVQSLHIGHVNFRDLAPLLMKIRARFPALSVSALNSLASLSFVSLRFRIFLIIL